MSNQHQAKDFLNDYNKHVVEQGRQFQIDHYYKPVNLIDRCRIDVVLKYLKPWPGERILDLGCGVGTFAYHCWTKGSLCWGIDFSQESINMARNLCQKFCDKHIPEFVVRDAMNTQFHDNFFDKIVCADFIEHISLEEKNKVVLEIKRILKPGGKAVIFTPNRIREDIGELYWKIRVKLFGGKVPKNDLHFGLTERKEFEPLLRNAGLMYRLVYDDTTRPWLAKIPLLKKWLSLNLIWVVKKRV